VKKGARKRGSFPASTCTQSRAEAQMKMTGERRVMNILLLIYSYYSSASLSTSFRFDAQIQGLDRSSIGGLIWRRRHSHLHQVKLFGLMSGDPAERGEPGSQLGDDHQAHDGVDRALQGQDQQVGVQQEKALNGGLERR